MKDSARYIRVVEWSEEDQCYIGSSPGLLFGGCHGDDEQAVYRELCQIIEETVEDIRASGRPLPAPTARSNVPR
jgi:predicted RNase H-like HicB family nuclease